MSSVFEKFSRGCDVDVNERFAQKYGVELETSKAMLSGIFETGLQRHFELVEGRKEECVKHILSEMEGSEFNEELILSKMYSAFTADMDVPVNFVLNNLNILGLVDSNEEAGIKLRLEESLLITIENHMTGVVSNTIRILKTLLDR